MNFIFRLGAHLQENSFYLCKFSQIWKNSKFETLLVLSISDEGHATCSRLLATICWISLLFNSHFLGNNFRNSDKNRNLCFLLFLIKVYSSRENSSSSREKRKCVCGLESDSNEFTQWRMLSPCLYLQFLLASAVSVLGLLLTLYLFCFPEIRSQVMRLSMAFHC
jgi:hypothetical protein